MRFRRSSVLAVIVGVLAGFPGPASAGIQDASEPPRTSGPLLSGPPDCHEDGFDGPGVTASQVCAWSYDLAPAETNVTEDFSGYWVQAEIEPAEGWCVYGIDFDTTGPDIGRLVSATPASDGDTRGDTAMELVVDGDGAAPMPGAIAQDVTLAKGRVRASFSPDRFQYAWHGKSPDKVLVAVGVQVAYDVLPWSLTYTWGDSVGLTTATCRPATVIRIGGR